MPTAYVLIRAELGAEDTVLQAVKDIQAVKEAYIVYGVHDLITRVEAPSIDVLKNTITKEIRGLAAVRNTQTMLVAPTANGSIF
jgi:DNA-binding Lrp family transcriptional regulator